jgi:hypothetical protein
MYLKSQHYFRLSHTVAVQVTITLNFLISAVAEHKLHPGNITCWLYIVTLAVDKTHLFAMVVWDNSLSPSTIIIQFLIAKWASIMNCTERYHYRVSNVIPVLSLVWHTRGPGTTCFLEPSLSCCRTTIPLIKQVSSLCAVTERASQAGCWDYHHKSRH